MRWFDPRSLESIEFDYDLDGAGEIYGDPFVMSAWAGKDDVLVSRTTGTISRPLWEVGGEMPTMDAITGGSFVFHKPNLKGRYNYDELFHDCEC